MNMLQEKAMQGNICKSLFAKRVIAISYLRLGSVYLSAWRFKSETNEVNLIRFKVNEGHFERKKYFIEASRRGRIT